MKDRFLSKAKRVNNGEWVEGNIIYVNKKYYMWPNSANDEKEAIENMWFIDPQTLCQCTGLKDKNGTRIFEGDIVDLVIDESAWGQYGKTKHVECCIAYDNGAFMYNRTNKNHSVRGCYPVQKYSGFVSVRVIGNIHDKEETQ